MTVGFTVDEEGDGTGSLALARTLNPRYALVLEGTGLDLAVTEAGHLDVQVVVRGTSVHTGAFEHGDSALEKAAHLVTELNRLPLAGHFDSMIGRSAINAISFHSGTSELNALPDRAELYLVGRLGRGLSVRQALDQLRTRRPEDRPRDKRTYRCPADRAVRPDHPGHSDQAVAGGSLIQTSVNPGGIQETTPKLNALRF